MNKKIGGVIGIFMIVLVLSLPIYSANVLAVSVQITRNQGEAGIDKYIDAQGDVWNVEALVHDAPSDILPEDLVVEVDGNEDTFDSCTQGPVGMVCEYISPLTEGIKANDYNFNVIYRFLNDNGAQEERSNADVIHADGHAPQIQFFTGNVAQQADGTVNLDFTVTDAVGSGPSVGLETIEVIDSQTGEILETYSAAGSTTFNYVSNAQTGGKIDAAYFTGVGVKHLKVKASDRLGHETSSDPVAFYLDLEKPAIGDLLNLTQLGKFMGTEPVYTDVVVEVDDINLAQVELASDNAQFTEAKLLASRCEEHEDIAGKFFCRFRDVRIDPLSSVSFTVSATDSFQNVGTRTLSASFTTDTQAPVIEYFGTDRVFEDKSFVRSGSQTIVLRVTEQGAGIDPRNIRADLQQLGGTSSDLGQCEEFPGGFECIWETTQNLAGASVVEVGLSQLTDNVGNEPDLPKIELHVDNNGPKVERIELFGVSAAGDKDYFQSNDRVKISFRAQEEVSGLVILVNVNDLVMDAATKFPEDELSRGLGDGWQTFTHDTADCTNVEGTWTCSVETDGIKSGFDTREDIEIKIQDTAGNDADWTIAQGLEDPYPRNVEAGSNGEYKIDILGLSQENNPDYWEVQSSRVDEEFFIDLDVTPLTFTRAPIDIQLRSPDRAALAREIELPPNGCVPIEGTSTILGSEGNETSQAPSSPVISRALLFGGNYPDGASPARFNLILEFEPFEGRELFNIDPESLEVFESASAKYRCTVRIYSQVGNDAIEAAELQEIIVDVPFRFSDLGAQDENIAKMVGDIKDSAAFVVPDKLELISDVIKWIRYLQPAITLVIQIATIIDAVTESGDDWRNNFPAYTNGLATAMCGGTQAAKTESSWEFLEYIQVPLQVLTCNPAPYEDTWYGNWQRSVINFFNTLKSGGMRQTVSLYDNLWVSVAGLCIPGIIYNLEKLRQIQCVHIDCLENMVPSGVTNIAGCQQVNDVLQCKYLWGEFVGYIMPFNDLWEYAKDLIKAALTNPLGLVRGALTFGCSFVMCGVSSKGTTFCDAAAVFVFALDVVDNIVGLVEAYPTISQDYCSRVGL